MEIILTTLVAILIVKVTHIAFQHWMASRKH